MIITPYGMHLTTNNTIVQNTEFTTHIHNVCIRIGIYMCVYVCIYHGRSRKNYCSVSLKKIDVETFRN